MMTAPTGQAVFDPFAPPPSTSPQPVDSRPVVADQIDQNLTQQVAPSAPQTEDSTPTQVNVTPLNHPHQTNVQADDTGITLPLIIPDENQVATKPDDINKPLLEPLDLPSPDSDNVPTDASRVVDDLEPEDQTIARTDVIETTTPLANFDQPDSQTSDVSAIDNSNEPNAALLAQVPDSTDVDLVDEPDDVPLVADAPEISDQPTDQVTDQTDPDQQSDFDLTEDERIALFDEVLTEAEQSASVFDQVMPAAILANDPLNPQNSNHSSARKPETVASNSVQQEAGLIGQVEFEPSSELPVEVEGFLERVEDHADKLPQEIVVANGSVQTLPQSHPTQTVIVLPITEEEGQAQVKDVKLSLAWLLEWSHKIIKKFVGKVVYRHEPNL